LARNTITTSSQHKLERKQEVLPMVFLAENFNYLACEINYD